MSYSNVFIIAADGIKDAIVAVLPDANLLRDEGGDPKIYRTQAPGDALPPYIVVSQIYGGREKVQPGEWADFLIKVCAVGLDQDTAASTANYIDTAIMDKQLTFSNNWCTWNHVHQINVIDEPEHIQNSQFWAVGGHYRIQMGRTS